MKRNKLATFAAAAMFICKGGSRTGSVAKTDPQNVYPLHVKF
jgi:hypothetical protein